MADLSQDFSTPALGTVAYRDLVIQNGDLVLTNDVSNSVVATDPTLQLVAARILFYLGEYFLNTEEGTPFLQQIVAKGATQQDIDTIFQERILGTPGVAVLTAYQSTPFPAQRLYRISFSVTTTTGAQVTQSLPVNLGSGAQ